MSQRHFDMMYMFCYARRLQRETNPKIQEKIWEDMKFLSDEMLSSSYFRAEIVKQYPDLDWDLKALVINKHFEYDLIYPLLRHKKDLNSVLDLMIDREDFSMQVVQDHPSLNWAPYAYKLVKVGDFDDGWKMRFPEWNWAVEETFEMQLRDKINRMSHLIDQALIMDETFEVERTESPTSVIDENMGPCVTPPNEREMVCPGAPRKRPVEKFKSGPGIRFDTVEMGSSSAFKVKDIVPILKRSN